MRMAKIKSGMALRRALQHNTRERIPSNAAPEKKLQNQIFGNETSEEAMERYQKMLPDKVRKNAVHAVELVFTASKEFSDSRSHWDDYLNKCDKWAMDLFGAENLLTVSHHYDEETPHSHVLVVPLKDQKLNANFFIGGSKERMEELQTDFYEKVGLQAGLERGQSKAETKSRHSHHTLSKKSAELDEREKVLAGKETKLEEREKKLKEFSEEFKTMIGMKPSDIRELKTKLANWDNLSPDSLRQFAQQVETKGFRTVGEYRQAQEAKREREQQQKHSFSR